MAAPSMTRVHEVARVDGQVILDGSQAVLVSNNPYETRDIAGMGQRARLDQGVLGVVSVKIETAAQAAAHRTGSYALASGLHQRRRKQKIIGVRRVSLVNRASRGVYAV